MPEIALDLSVLDLFDLPTVADLARHLTEGEAAANGTADARDRGAAQRQALRDAAGPGEPNDLEPDPILLAYNGSDLDGFGDLLAKRDGAGRTGPASGTSDLVPSKANEKAAVVAAKAATRRAINRVTPG